MIAFLGGCAAATIAAAISARRGATALARIGTAAATLLVSASIHHFAAARAGATVPLHTTASGVLGAALYSAVIFCAVFAALTAARWLAALHGVKAEPPASPRSTTTTPDPKEDE